MQLYETLQIVSQTVGYLAFGAVGVIIAVNVWKHVRHYPPFNK